MVSFTDAIRLGFQRHFDFDGRSTRAEYWWWLLFLVLVDLLLGQVDTMAGTYWQDPDNPMIRFGLFGVLFFAVTLIPSLSLGARRLRDINKSGWWQLILVGAIFVVPIVILWWWATKPTDEGNNRYGPDPRHPDDGQFYLP